MKGRKLYKIFGIVLIGILSVYFSFPISVGANKYIVRDTSQDKVYRVVDYNRSEYRYKTSNKTEIKEKQSKIKRKKSKVKSDIVSRKKKVDLSHPYAKDEIVVKLSGGDEYIVKDILETIAIKNLDNLGEGRLRIKIDSKKIRERIIEQRKRLGQEAVDVDDVKLFESVIESLNELKFVEYAEPNYVAKSLYIPNDEYYNMQWNLKMIGMEKAWDLSKGEGTIIAVLDSGVAYEDRGLYKKAPNLKYTKFTKPFNVFNKTQYANDDNGHGTHITGIIAGSTDDREGTAGIAYRASIMPIKVLDNSGYGTYADIADGIIKAVDQGADIINLSLGGTAESMILFDAVKYAYDNNVLVVVASGNDGDEGLYYPARYKQYVLSVGAVGADKEKTSYSNYGNNLEIVAPGGELGEDKNNDGESDGILQQTLRRIYNIVLKRMFNYYLYEGTSVAAPQVAGVAGLIKSMGIDDVDEIEEIIKSTTEDLGDTGWDKYTGYGLVRADKAVLLAQSRLQDSGNTNDLPDNDNANNDDTDSSQNNQDQQNETNPDTNNGSDDNPPSNNNTNNSQNNGDSGTTDENQNQEFTLETYTYNMWGRRSDKFEFWESVYIGSYVKDMDTNPIPDVDVDIKIYDEEGDVVAQGKGQTDNDGELWVKVGRFKEGRYHVESFVDHNGVQKKAKTNFYFKGFGFRF